MAVWALRAESKLAIISGLDQSAGLSGQWDHQEGQSIMTEHELIDAGDDHLLAPRRVLPQSCRSSCCFC